jgi:RHS repeat-associated protein
MLLVAAAKAGAQNTNPYPAGAAISYVRTWDAAAPVQTTGTLLAGGLQSVKQTTQYLDGLGRPLQAVARQGSLATNSAPVDLVSPVVYDGSGREQYKFLPFAASNEGGNTHIDDGAFKLNPFQQQATFSAAQYPGEAYYYSKAVFDGSPFNKVTKSMAPGNSWVGSSRGIAVKESFNTDIDDVKIWHVAGGGAGSFGMYAVAGVYPAGELFKTIITDEAGNQVIEFKDKEGKVILKKVQIGSAGDDGTGSNYTDWLCTYYIYDDFNNLRCVIQPEAVKAMALPVNNWTLSTIALAEQCFRYEYDSRNRIVMKQVPGAAAVQMIYDARDRVVMTQDGNLRAAHQWLYMQYDALNRPVATGAITDNVHYNDAVYHSSLAIASTAYPDLNNYSVKELLTQTFYDDYNWLAGAGNPFSSTYSTAYDSYFEPVSNTAWPYGQANAQSTAIKGAITGTKTKILGTGNYIYSISYYDAKGRVIQSKATNITGGTDISTTQYTWTGQPLVSIVKQERQGTGAQATVIVSRNTYDDLSRLSKVEKKISNTLVNAGAMTDYKATLTNEYDKLGQLKTKNLSPDQSTAGPLEKEKFEYNIRGWLLGMNRDYTRDENTDNYFGFDLGYDKVSNNLIANMAYAAPQLNGNIAGTVWKSRGDGEKRMYDFTYDKANRLTEADFNQYTNSTFNKDAGVDFSVSELSYDANGNILGMTQMGLKLNESLVIDQLSYSYLAGSNKLAKVVDDALADDSGKLGDFKDGTNIGKDYAYDANGNMISDANKMISSIQYNYLNLPQLISITAKGTIAYTYDAGGNKIRKVTTDNSTSGKTITTTTDYLSGFIYESKTTIPADANSPDYAGVLQFTGHEEGRIRLKPAEGADSSKFVFDYFLKDHLGNVRSVITQDVGSMKHYAASFETAVRTYENALFANIEETAFPVSGLKQTGIAMPPLPDCYGCMFFPDSPPPGGIFSGPSMPDNEYVSRLNGNGKKIGATLSLKVAAGDKIDLGTYVWYPDASPTSSSEPEEDVLQSLLGTLSGDASGLSGGLHTPSELGNATNGLLLPGLMAFLDSHNEPVDDMHNPKTYINWVLFDDNFNYVPEGSGFIQAKITSNEVQTLARSFTLPKSGFFFVYLSNETQHFDVFFDQLVVNHTPSAILEETHYYPFGLVMSGISSKAAGGIINKDKTFQGQQFDDDLGINYVEFRYRNHDPQIGRFIEIDPLSDKYVYNSTYAFSENKVTAHIELEGLESVPYAIAQAWHQAGISSNTDPVEYSKVLGKAALEPRNWIRGYVMAGEIAMPLVLTTIMTGGAGDGVVFEAEMQSFKGRPSTLAANPAESRAAFAAIEESPGIDLTVNAKKTWNADQLAQATAKVEALSNSETVVTKNPVARDPKLRSNFIKAGGVVNSTQHVDHIVDLQLGGTNANNNLQALDGSVNSSLGKQLQLQMRNLPDQTIIRKVTLIPPKL